MKIGVFLDVTPFNMVDSEEPTAFIRKKEIAVFPPNVDTRKYLAYRATMQRPRDRLIYQNHF
jgi:hypothetical protein